MKKDLSVLISSPSSRKNKRLFCALWVSCCLHFLILYGEFIAIPKSAPLIQTKAMAITLKPLAFNQPKLENTSIVAINKPITKVIHSTSLPAKSNPKKTIQKKPNKSPNKSQSKKADTKSSNMVSQAQSSLATSQLDQKSMASDAFYLGDNTYVEGDFNSKATANLKNTDPPILGVKIDDKGFLVPTQTLNSLPKQLTLSITLMGLPGTIIWKQNQGSYDIEGRALGKKALSTGRNNGEKGLLPDDFLYLKNNSHFDYESQQISYFYGGNPKTESFDIGAQDLLSLPFHLAWTAGQFTQLQLATGKNFNRYNISVEDKKIHIIKIHFDPLRTIKVSAKNETGDKLYDVYLAVDFANIPVKIDSIETDKNGKQKKISVLVQSLKWNKTPLIERLKRDYK